MSHVVDIILRPSRHPPQFLMGLSFPNIRWLYKAMRGPFLAEGSSLSNFSLLTITSDQKLTSTIYQWCSDKGIDVVFSLHPRLVLAAAAFNPDGPIKDADVCLFDIGSDDASFVASIASTMDSFGIPVVFLVDEIPQPDESSCTSQSTRYLLKSISADELGESVLAALDQKSIESEARN